MTITVTITDEQRLNLLTSALEGGSNYWYLLGDDATNIIDKHFPATKDTCFVDRMWAAIKAGLSIPIRDIEEDEKIGEISLASIEKGEQLLADHLPNHLADILNENDDANTGDVWFQYCSLGELVYG